MTDPVMSMGSNAASRVTAMESAPYMRGTRAKFTIQAAIGVAATVPFPVVFDKQLPAGAEGYSVVIAFEGTDTGILGSLSAMVQGGVTKTLAGCTINVKNSALVSLGLNVTCHVIAVY